MFIFWTLFINLIFAQEYQRKLGADFPAIKWQEAKPDQERVVVNELESKPFSNRYLSVIVGPEGYYPSEVSVFQGEKIRFFLTSTQEAPDCMMVQGHELFLSASKGKISEAELEFKSPGKFQFFCPGSKKFGRITVLPKGEDPQKRSPASQRVELWTPKEYD